MNSSLQSGSFNGFSGRRFFRIGFFLFLCVHCLSCGPRRLPAVELVIERPGMERVSVQAELAKTPEERNQGLMHRKRLADGKGMLFIFDRDEMVSFWMKNTYIPLSIAFIASDGRIMEIRDMQPHDLTSVKSSRSVRYALEVPQGWFTRANVSAGHTVVLDAIH